MADKQQLAQMATAGDVLSIWQWIHGVIGGAVVWLGNQFVQTAIKEKLEANKSAVESLHRELAALRDEIAEMKAESRERKAIAEAQQRSIDRLLNKLEGFK